MVGTVNMQKLDLSTEKSSFFELVLNPKNPMFVVLQCTDGWRRRTSDGGELSGEEVGRERGIHGEGQLINTKLLQGKHQDHS